MDYIALTALVVAVVGALGHFIKESHIQHCKICFCVDSDCRDKKNKTPTITPCESTSEI